MFGLKVYVPPIYHGVQGCTPRVIPVSDLGFRVPGLRTLFSRNPTVALY